MSKLMEKVKLKNQWKRTSKSVILSPFLITEKLKLCFYTKKVLKNDFLDALELIKRTLLIKDQELTNTDLYGDFSRFLFPSKNARLEKA